MVVTDMRPAFLLLPLLFAGAATAEAPELHLVGPPRAGRFSLTVGGVPFAEAAPLTVQCEASQGNLHACSVASRHAMKQSLYHFM